MDLTQFVDVRPDNPAGIKEFLDLNALNHNVVHAALLQNGIAVAQYPLFADEITQDWLDIHYKEHLAWANSLNLPVPVDLNNVDVKNSAQLSDWLDNHFASHYLIQQALNIG